MLYLYNFIRFSQTYVLFLQREPTERYDLLYIY